MSAANTNISALRAEVLLNHLYPEQSDSWVVTNKGTFYRNYSEDVLQLEANLSQVSLSRDGLLRLLPQGLVNTKDELKTAEELFVPFDSWRFRDSLRAEEDFAYLLENRLNIILKTYYGVDIDAETNPLIREMMKLLPLSRSIRGNFHKIGDILKALLNKRVTTHITCYNWSDKTADTQPMVCYKVWVPELTSESYKELEKNIEALKNFLVEWFIPFDTYCAIEIKAEKNTSLNNAMLLNYNTKLSL
jgi:hypothetical protein